jgi:hypothetical protein
LEKYLPTIIKTKKISSDKISAYDYKLYKVLSGNGSYKFVYILLVAIFILFWLLNLLSSFSPVDYYRFDIWYSPHYPLGFVFRNLFSLLYSSILLSIFFYKFIFSIVGFSRLFRQLSNEDGFIINPLAPDKCGGLKTLTSLSKYFMYMLFPFIFFYLSILLLEIDYNFAIRIQFGFLIILAIVTFFLPLGSIHSAMRRSKILKLEEINVHFYTINKKINYSLKNKHYENSFVDLVASLEKLNYLYNVTNKMPTWPFNFPNGKKLFTASLIPLIIFVIEQLSNPESLFYPWRDLIERIFK